MKYALLAFAFALAACGAEAPPSHAPSGISVSGEINMGVGTKR